MAELKKKIEAMEPGSEERKMGVREWRRLKRIPAGSVENGVIRSYVSRIPMILQDIVSTKICSSNGSRASHGQTRFPHPRTMPGSRT